MSMTNKQAKVALQGILHDRDIVVSIQENPSSEDVLRVYHGRGNALAIVGLDILHQEPAEMDFSVIEGPQRSTFKAVRDEADAIIGMFGDNPVAANYL